ncbi:MAG: hypothetical protein KAQ98_03240 [Bacteriovoracaceae bacterium]|nr:hypothetical protein [Bacteriovoracaceae bacterium]
MSQQTDQIQKNEVGKTIRNFRNSTDIESFYRFLSDNDLRREAKSILGIVVGGLKKMNSRKKRKNKRKLQ